MNHILICLLTLFFSLSGPAMGKYSDFGRWSLAAGRLAGSGPAPGVLEVSDLVKSTKAFQNYKPGQAIEFVFDPKRNRFVVGRAVGRGSPHQNLAAIIDADSSVVGGMFKRGSNGEILTNEFSGHYWENWTPAVRTQFQQHLERLSGQAINHTPGM